MNRRNTGPTDRNLLNHGAGKGDKTRVQDAERYGRNFDEIVFPQEAEVTFFPEGQKLVKKYK